MHLNIYWFMQTLLERGDRMGSHYGLDIRVPFCDYQIAEYLYAVPWSFKDYKGREKGLLREAIKGVLPESVLYRKKSPFPKTHDPRYLESVSNIAREMLLNQNAPIFQFVNREMFEHLLSTDFQWPWYGQLMRRPQTIAYMIQINYWLEHYSVRIV
jgi:asparagine synthase (glutamine-hydrolysing)